MRPVLLSMCYVKIVMLTCFVYLLFINCVAVKSSTSVASNLCAMDYAGVESINVIQQKRENSTIT